jgi:hypothetical protein
MHGIQAVPSAEAVLGAMFALSREVAGYAAQSGATDWDRETRAAARLLAGRRVTIVGVGAIAEALAPKCGALGRSAIQIRVPAPLPRLHQARGAMVPVWSCYRMAVEVRSKRAAKPEPFLQVELKSPGVQSKIAVIN